MDEKYDKIKKKNHRLEKLKKSIYRAKKRNTITKMEKR